MSLTFNYHHNPEGHCFTQRQQHGYYLSFPASISGDNIIFCMILQNSFVFFLTEGKLCLKLLKLVTEIKAQKCFDTLEHFPTELENWVTTLLPLVCEVINFIYLYYLFLLALVCMCFHAYMYLILHFSWELFKSKVIELSLLYYKMFVFNHHTIWKLYLRDC